MAGRAGARRRDRPADAEIAIEVQRVQQMEARPAAYTAELVAELATRRPDTLDRPIDEPGAASLDWLTRPRPAGGDRSE
jgi:hypothetical protein